MKTKTIQLVQGLAVEFDPASKLIRAIILNGERFPNRAAWNGKAFLEAWPSWEEIDLHVSTLSANPDANEYTPEDARRDSVGSYHRELAEVFPDGFRPQS